MVQPTRISPRWTSCIVAATGPSLTAEIAAQCKGFPVVAVNDAYRLFPYADLMYACDAGWWRVHGGCPDFMGEKWSSHGDDRRNNKLATAEKYGLRLVHGRDGNRFSLDPGYIYYGSNSGFQAINLAILFGATHIVLVGFDMRDHKGKRHFFGDHPKQLVNTGKYERFIPNFVQAENKLPSHIRIWNATPKSALTCFPLRPLEDCLVELETLRATAA